MSNLLRAISAEHYLNYACTLRIANSITWTILLVFWSVFCVALKPTYGKYATFNAPWIQTKIRRNIWSIYFVPNPKQRLLHLRCRHIIYSLIHIFPIPGQPDTPDRSSFELRVSRCNGCMPLFENCIWPICSCTNWPWCGMRLLAPGVINSAPLSKCMPSG